MEATSDRRATANSTGAIATNFKKIRQLEKMPVINRRIRSISLKHAQRALTRGTDTMKSKHLVALAAVFLFAAVARADDAQGPVTDSSLIGKLHGQANPSRTTFSWRASRSTVTAKPS
jgi:hypothetical protein